MDLTGEQLELRSNLEFTRTLMRQGIKTPSPLHYLGIADFVLREGQFFSPRPLPEGMGYREMSRCYLNSFITAMEENLRYVEGYALSVSHCLPVLHAWNLDRRGLRCRYNMEPTRTRVFRGCFSTRTNPERSRRKAIRDH